MNATAVSTPASPGSWGVTKHGATTRTASVRQVMGDRKRLAIEAADERAVILLTPEEARQLASLLMAD